MIAALGNLWCWLMHRRFTTWQRSGEWLIYRCAACEAVWLERRCGAPRGSRHEGSAA